MESLELVEDGCGCLEFLVLDETDEQLCWGGERGVRVDGGGGEEDVLRGWVRLIGSGGSRCILIICFVFGLEERVVYASGIDFIVRAGERI